MPFSNLVQRVREWYKNGASSVDEEEVLNLINEIRQQHGQDVVEKTFRLLSKILRKTRHNVVIQRRCCQEISALALDTEQAMYMVTEGAVEIVLRSLHKHMSDSNVCWLACSAIWNLARPAETRHLIPLQCVDLVFDVLERHQESRRVVQCALGALSNLAIMDQVQERICTNDRLKLLLQLSKRDLSSADIAICCCGLSANLAISDEVAQQLVNCGLVEYLFAVLQKHTDASTELLRNWAAALSNICTAEGFVEELTRFIGVEVVNQLHTHVADPVTRSLVNNVREVAEIGCDSVSSLHLAASNNFLTVVPHLLSKHNWLNVRVSDSKGLTPVDYAIKKGHEEMVAYLIECGARVNQNANDISQSMNKVIASANVKRETLLAEYKTEIAFAANLNSDVSGAVLQFARGFDLVSARK